MDYHALDQDFKSVLQQQEGERVKEGELGGEGGVSGAGEAAEEDDNAAAATDKVCVYTS